MAEMLYDADADLSVIQGRNVAVLDSTFQRTGQKAVLVFDGAARRARTGDREDAGGVVMLLPSVTRMPLSTPVPLPATPTTVRVPVPVLLMVPPAPAFSSMPFALVPVPRP